MYKIWFKDGSKEIVFDNSEADKKEFSERWGFNVNELRGESTNIEFDDEDGNGVFGGVVWF